MKFAKIISTILITVSTIFCLVLFTSNTTVEKSNSEQIISLSKEISNLKKEIKALDTKRSSFGENVYMGEIAIFGGNFAPRGYMDCNGQLLSISRNSALFSLLGTMYGGDGRTTFALPNLNKKDNNGRVKNPRYIIAVQGTYPSRN